MIGNQEQCIFKVSARATLVLCVPLNYFVFLLQSSVRFKGELFSVLDTFLLPLQLTVHALISSDSQHMIGLHNTG